MIILIDWSTWSIYDLQFNIICYQAITIFLYLIILFKKWVWTCRCSLFYLFYSNFHALSSSFLIPCLCLPYKILDFLSLTMYFYFLTFREKYLKLYKMCYILNIHLIGRFIQNLSLFEKLFNYFLICLDL